MPGFRRSLRGTHQAVATKSRIRTSSSYSTSDILISPLIVWYLQTVGFSTIHSHQASPAYEDDGGISLDEDDLNSDDDEPIIYESSAPQTRTRHHHPSPPSLFTATAAIQISTTTPTASAVAAGATQSPPPSCGYCGGMGGAWTKRG